MAGLRLGKLPATRDDRDLVFAPYVDTSKLPAVPSRFGHENVIAAKGWGMLGNDQWGDCAWAGPAHETMLLTTLGERPATFTTEGVLEDYAAGTGFDPKAGPPGENPTDRGSEVRKVLGYRRSTGIVDVKGARHKIGAYIRLDEKNLQEVYLALYLFEAIGIGIEFPDSAMRQFNAGEVWDVVPGARVEGGHYVCGVGKDEHLQVVTWGALQGMTEAFFDTYCDEAWAYVSTEDLRHGKSLEGFDLEQLQSDLAALA
jgi:hypothetical protein